MKKFSECIDLVDKTAEEIKKIVPLSQQQETDIKIQIYTLMGAKDRICSENPIYQQIIEDEEVKSNGGIDE